MITLIVFSFLVASVAVFVLLRRAKQHARLYGADMPQRFHAGDVPRLGGAGILVGTIAGWLMAGLQPGDPFHVGWSAGAAALAVVCLLPAVVGGILEDITQRVPARLRLVITLCSAAMFCWLLGLGIDRVGIPAIDARLASSAWLAAIFAAFAIGGLPHAFNLIDGYNGLAGTVSMLTCLAISHVALQLGDRQLAASVLCLAGATAGFLVFNYPRGKIFAGDGGAYVWGMVIAVACVTLVQRHGAVSPWFPVLLLVYPVCETMFSIYRKMARGQSPGAADRLHFHQLIFRRLVRPVFLDDEDRQLLMRNNKTAPYLWMFSASSIVPAVLLWRNTVALAIFSLLFVLAYVAAYLMIVRFKVPGWLRF
ncbi:glycosyltransferase [Xylophilus sp. GOD-11R]|uniref:MraY family glycosyltransferase n=1 Tax=Xylophilus sp. GOD-11R TaxID=3089814 RepID=UPI00298D1EE0|nr:glycosyltransferase [Xylophilus sp. GOD-11R]WPB57807.1 glycosyltransferase [Xylophilus sp. GOD-11R]